MSRQLMMSSLSYDMLLCANFPPVGHVFHNRNEATKLFNMQGMLRCTQSRTGGLEVENGNTTYKCNDCAGVMKVAFPSGRKMPGEVTAVEECTCMSAETFFAMDPTRPPEATNEAGAKKAVISYLHFVHKIPTIDATDIQPLGWEGNEPTAKVLYDAPPGPIPAYGSAGHKRQKTSLTKDYFLQLYDGRWFKVVLAGLIGQDKALWVAKTIPEPLSSATFPSTTCLSPPADAKVLDVDDILHIGADLCMVCLDSQSTGRWVCGNSENPAVESSTGCKGAQVCDLCKTQMCLMPMDISHESTTFFIIPAAKQELKCLHNCRGSRVAFFEPKGGDGKVLPLLFPFAQLWKRPFRCMQEVVEAAWAFDTFVAPIFNGIKEDLKEASDWRHKLDVARADSDSRASEVSEDEEERERMYRRIVTAERLYKKFEERAQSYRFPDWSEDLTMALRVPKRMRYKNPEEEEAAAAYYAEFDLGHNPRTLEDLTPPWAKDETGELWKYLHSKHRVGTGTTGSFWQRYGHATLPSSP